MKIVSGLFTIALFFLLMGCQNYYNDMITWTDNIEKGASIQKVQRIQPEYIEIDWDHPSSYGNEKRFLIKKIKGNKDILDMTNYLVFVDNGYVGRESHK